MTPDEPTPTPNPQPTSDDYRREDGTVDWLAFRAAVDAWRPSDDKGEDESPA